MIYGTLFALFSIGNAVGPYLMDLSFHHAGSYVPMMLAFVGSLAVACGLLLPLGPYRYAVSIDEDRRRRGRGDIKPQYSAALTCRKQAGYGAVSCAAAINSYNRARV